MVARDTFASHCLSPHVLQDCPDSDSVVASETSRAIVAGESRDDRARSRRKVTMKGAKGKRDRSLRPRSYRRFLYLPRPKHRGRTSHRIAGKEKGRPENNCDAFFLDRSLPNRMQLFRQTREEPSHNTIAQAMLRRSRAMQNKTNP